MLAKALQPLQALVVGDNDFSHHPQHTARLYQRLSALDSLELLAVASRDSTSEREEAENASLLRHLLRSLHYLDLGEALILQLDGPQALLADLAERRPQIRFISLRLGGVLSAATLSTLIKDEMEM